MNNIINESILIDDDEQYINKNNISEKTDKNFIEFNINNIFLNADFDINGKEKILCIGKVQSGKTRNIIECIKKAMDLEYDGIFFFTGTNNILLNQGLNRLDQFLNEDINNKKYRLITSKNANQIGQYLDFNRKFIACLLKISDVYKIAYDTLNHSTIQNKKILIIDDESDYGSINTGTKESPTLFYEKLESLYKRITKGKLIYFTATPFANILNKSSQNNPPKIVVLKNHEDYYGIKKFNDNSELHYVYLSNDKGQIKDDYYFFIYSTVIIHILNLIDFLNKNNPEQKNKKTQLLINYSLDTYSQEKIYKYLEEILNDMNNRKEFQTKNSFLEKIKEFSLNIDILEFEKNFSEFYYKKIKEFINYFLENKSYFLLNGNNIQGKEIFFKNTFDHEIIIGGNMLSRGVTFENLITQLILNYPNKIYVDTLLQRCRWFGYRKERADNIKIIMTQEFKKALFSAEKYVNIFKPGIQDFFLLKKEIMELDNHTNQKKINVKGTCDEKSK